MQIGPKRHRVTLQTQSAVKDALGQSMVSWVDSVIVWADVEDMSGRELQQANVATNEVATKMTIRYRPGLSEAMRAVFRGQPYKVLAILGTDLRQRVLVCERIK